MYAQELRFNLNGKTEVASVSGYCFSLLIRAFVLICLIERLVAWQTLDKFKFEHFDEIIDFEKDEYTLDDLSFSALKFDIMVGFDRILPPEVGRFDFGLLTYGGDGVVSDLRSVSSQTCGEDHPGVKFAERETGLIYGQSFNLACFGAPEGVGVTGNRDSVL